MKWMIANLFWVITWALLIINICISVFHGLRLRRKTQTAMQRMETRLKDDAQVRKTLGKTYEERLAEEYKKRGLSG